MARSCNRYTAFNVVVVGQHRGSIIVRWQAGLVRAAKVGLVWMAIAAVAASLYLPNNLLPMAMAVGLVSPFAILGSIVARAVNEPLDSLPHIGDDE